MNSSPLSAHRDHRRAWAGFRFVYPVISRRAGGVSIGINLNPDKVCNFDCVYCEVDRTAAPVVREVDPAVLETELRTLLSFWKTGELFAHAPFSEAPPAWRDLRTITFSGDGEPTTSPVFDRIAGLVTRLRDELAPAARVTLITDSACLSRPRVRAGLDILARGSHEIWAKLDAGTPARYRAVNRSRVPYARILANITAAARAHPLHIQTLFLRLHGRGPDAGEIDAYCDRLDAIRAGGGRILGLQLCTVARPVPEPYAEALADEELDAIAARIRVRNGLPQRLAYGQTLHVSRRADRSAAGSDSAVGNPPRP